MPARAEFDRLRPALRLVLMAVCATQAWVIVFVLKIGPVVGTIDAGAGHGLHSGDLFAVPLAGTAALLHAAGRRATPARSMAASIRPR